jgi:4a-hydroxytetrahydrobiopterin dehydratase
MANDLLDLDARREALAALPAWRHEAARDALVRRYTFDDFGQAFAFMTRVALAAERHDHHPEWSNTWNRVDIAWTSHDVKGLSRRDVEMALITEAAAGSAS